MTRRKVENRVEAGRRTQAESERRLARRVRGFGAFPTGCAGSQVLVSWYGRGGTELSASSSRRGGRQRGAGERALEVRVVLA